MSDQSILVVPEHVFDKSSPLEAFNSSPYNSRGTAAMTLMRTSPNLKKERRGPYGGEWMNVWIVSDLDAFRKEAENFGVRLHGACLERFPCTA